MKIAVRVLWGFVAVAVVCGLALAYIQTRDDWNIASGDLAQGKYDQAIKKYDLALSLPLWTNAYRAKLLIDRGQVHGQLNQIDAAIADFNAALALQADNVDALAYRAYAHFTQNRFSDAISDYNQVLTIIPNNPNMHYWRGMSYEGELNFEKAIADFDLVAKQGVIAFDAIQHHSYDLARLGKSAEAVEVVKLLSIDRVYEPKAYVARANLYDMAGGFEQALADYDTALRLKPDNAVVYQQRGLAYFGHGQLHEALTDFNKAIELEPNNATLYHNRGLAYAASDRTEKAMQDFSRSVEISSDQKYALIWLQLMRLKMGLAPEIKKYLPAKDKPDEAWPTPVIHYLGDQIDAAALRAAVLKEPLPIRRIDMSCEAEYYIGARALSEGRRYEALPLIRKSVEICPPAFVELISAKYELGLY